MAVSKPKVTGQNDGARESVRVGDRKKLQGGQGREERGKVTVNEEKMARLLSPKDTGKINTGLLQ